MSAPHQLFISKEMRAEISGRIIKIQNEMASLGAEAMLVASNANLIYSSGRLFRGYVFIPSSGHAIYFVMRPTVFDKEEDVVYIRKPEQIPEHLDRLGIRMPDTVALERDTLFYSEEIRLEKVFGNATVVNASQALRNARMVKTPFELKLMEIDGTRQAEAYRHISGLYHSDMTDIELQIEIERVLRREGCLGYPRVAGRLMEISLGSLINGDNADVPGPYEFAMGGAGIDPSLPGGADGSIMHPGTTVMVDMNGAFNEYQTDMTRVWRIGEIPEIAFKAHECSRRILRTLEKEALPGIAASTLYDRALAIAEEEGLADFFMGHRQKAGFIGHGVGIELNEMPPIAPRISTPLAENMTIALEPKFVIPHIGAVGVENTYVVTAEGLRPLTVFPEEIQELPV